MGSPANSSSLQTTIQDEIRCKYSTHIGLISLPHITYISRLLPLSAFSQLSLLMLRPSPRLRPMPTTATMVMDWPIMATATVTPMLMVTTTARDLQMLSLRPMPTTATTTVMDWPTTATATLTTATTATPMLTMDTTTARGPPMLSPLLMLTTATITVMLLTVMLTVVTTATLMPTMDTTDTDIITKLLLFC